MGEVNLHFERHGRVMLIFILNGAYGRGYTSFLNRLDRKIYPSFRTHWTDDVTLPFEGVG
jgi:hypothetical protein